jgi:hypothetical protein
VVVNKLKVTLLDIIPHSDLEHYLKSTDILYLKKEIKKENNHVPFAG